MHSGGRLLHSIVGTGVIACLLLGGACGRSRPRTGDELDPRISDLLARMTLREKVGQMTQLELGMITEGSERGIRIDEAKLHKAVIEYGVGSILNVKDVALPLDTWRQLVTRIQQAAATTPLRIPVIYGLDSIHGANYLVGATVFPQPLGMAATWNPDLVRDAARITAAETRGAGVAWNFAPVLDVGRQPLWSRLYETFGEDPYLASALGVASVQGYQGEDPAAPTHVAATLKHYVGYSGPVTGHDRSPALIPEITMRESFLPPFAAGVDAGALAVMVNSGTVNGVPGHLNRWLLQDVLRGEMGFRGLVVSDWEDIRKLTGVHHVAADEKDATRQAILAGIDMSMVPGSYSFSELLERLVKDNGVSMSRIDEAVGRILTLKLEVGLLDEPLRGMREATAIGSEASRRVALEAARESIVLAKNDAARLPLAAGARVLVTGPTADSLPALNNGWTISWTGDRADLYPTNRPTIRGALEAALPGQVTFVPGTTFDAPIDIPAAAAAAAGMDAAIVCLGERSYAETPGDIDTLTLPAAQLDLAEAIAATGTPVILVVVEGRPRLIRRIANRTDAIVVALNPGHEGGRAIAEILTGAVNPSGRLPITYPRYPNALLTYDHTEFEEVDKGWGLERYTPEFVFGSGLSYTTFGYSNLQVEGADARLEAPATVHVTVSNTGSRPGAEVAQLYVSDLVASVVPPVKRLKGFQRVELKPGESRQLTFTLTRADLSFVGADGRRVIEPGEFMVQVGTLQQKIVRR